MNETFQWHILSGHHGSSTRNSVLPIHLVSEPWKRQHPKGCLVVAFSCRVVDLDWVYIIYCIITVHTQTPAHTCIHLSIHIHNHIFHLYFTYAGIHGPPNPPHSCVSPGSQLLECKHFNRLGAIQANQKSWESSGTREVSPDTENIWKSWTNRVFVFLPSRSTLGKYSTHLRTHVCNIYMHT